MVGTCADDDGTELAAGPVVLADGVETPVVSAFVVVVVVVVAGSALARSVPAGEEVLDFECTTRKIAASTKLAPTPMPIAAAIRFRPVAAAGVTHEPAVATFGAGAGGSIGCDVAIGAAVVAAWACERPDNAVMRRSDTAESGGPNGASAWASSTTDWNRSPGRFAKQRSIAMESAGGTSGLPSGECGSDAIRAHTSGTVSPVNGGRPASIS